MVEYGSSTPTRGVSGRVGGPGLRRPGLYGKSTVSGQVVRRYRGDRVT